MTVKSATSGMGCGREVSLACARREADDMYPAIDPESEQDDQEELKQEAGGARTGIDGIESDSETETGEIPWK